MNSLGYYIFKANVTAIAWRRFLVAMFHAVRTRLPWTQESTYEAVPRTDAVFIKSLSDNFHEQQSVVTYCFMHGVQPRMAFLFATQRGGLEYPSTDEAPSRSQNS